MNAIEAAALCRYVKACCPQQKIDEFTPDAWLDLLEDIDFEQAKYAARQVAKRQPFVAPAEIRAEVAVINQARERSLPPVVYPVALADSPQAEQQWKRIWGDAVLAGHTEDRAREIANVQMQVIDDEPLAIGVGPAAALKAQMNADALELVRKQSLADADARAKSIEKRERYKRIRESELARTTTHNPDPEREPRDTGRRDEEMTG